jgi:hypothetical protein
MRYRVEYLHLHTSARLTFTVETDGLDGMARGFGNAWLHRSGLHLSDFAFLSVVALRKDGHAHTAEAACDILSRVPEQYSDRGTLHVRMQVGRDDQHEGTPDPGPDVLPA